VAANEPESDVLEFKELISNSAAAKAIAAIANHRGGNLMFGVREENGRAAGLAPIALAGASERVANIARDASTNLWCRPR
jgi:predicted HTH transcriptional regulator